MAIDRSWISYLFAKHRRCFTTRTWESVRPSICVSDFMMELFRIPAGQITNEDQLYRWAVQKIDKRFEFLIRNSPQVVLVVLFDIPEYVPLAKAVTQVSRSAKGDEPDFVTYGATPFASGFFPPIPQILNHRPWRRQMIELLTDRLSRDYVPSFNAMLVIDGGRAFATTLGYPVGIARKGFLHNFMRDGCLYHDHDPADEIPIEMLANGNLNSPKTNEWCDLPDCSNRIGESDLRIAYWLQKFPIHEVLVDCNDGDLVPILVVSAKDRICPISGMMVGPVHLGITLSMDVDEMPPECNTEGHSKSTFTNDKKTRVQIELLANTTELWKCIIRSWGSRGIRNPTEMFAVLCIMTGSDFVANFPELGFKRVLEGFETFAHKHMPIVTLSRVASDGVTPYRPRDHSQLDLEIDPLPVFAFGSSPVWIDDIEINETNFAAFVADCYSIVAGGIMGVNKRIQGRHDRKLMKDAQAAAAATAVVVLPPDTVTVQCSSDAMSGEKRKRIGGEEEEDGDKTPPPQAPRPKAPLITHEYIVANTRRISWNLCYWANGMKIDVRRGGVGIPLKDAPIQINDPIGIDPVSRDSLCGWKLSDLSAGEKLSNVSLAGRVSCGNGSMLHRAERHTIE